MKQSDELKLGNDGCGIQTSHVKSFSSATDGDNNNKTREEAVTTTDYALSLLRGFRNERSSGNKAEVGSNGSNGGSDTNSGLVSFGNNSFLFQFDGEEGGLTNGSFPTSESDNKIGGSDSDGEGRDSRSSGDGPRIDPPTSGGVAFSSSADVSRSAARTVSSSSRTNSIYMKDQDSSDSMSGLFRGNRPGPNSLPLSVSGSAATSNKRIGHPSSKSSVSSLTMSSQNDFRVPTKGGAQKSMIMRDGNMQTHHDDGVVRGAIHIKSSIGSYRLDQHNESPQLIASMSGSKRRMDSECVDDNDSMEGYSSDDEGIEANHPALCRHLPSASGMTSSNISTHLKGIIPDGSTNNSVSSGRLSASRGDDVEADHSSGKRKKTDDHKREERNAREKERSFRISKQINELRTLLSSGGVIVPKGTKSSVLTEAANYIRMLQQHQYRSEIDRHQLVQQMQQIGNGALGPQAANAIRVVAAQNGVWSLGNFGGLPPQNTSNNTTKQDANEINPQINASISASQNNCELVTAVEENEYRHIFHSCSIAMAVATMGGLFVDCNSLFCQLSQYTKKEVCALTIFTLTSRDDLQIAFDLISRMITPSAMSTNQYTQCVLRGSMKHRRDLGLSISLIKGEDGIAKYFCVTLIQNPTSPFDKSKPVPATAAMILSSSDSGMDSKPSDPKGTDLSKTATLTSG